MGRQRATDLAWDDEEVLGRTWADAEAATSADAVGAAAVLSSIVATVASVLWQATDVAWPWVLVLGLGATAVGALAVVRARRRRVRSTSAIVLLALCVPSGPMVLSWVVLGLVVGAA